MESTNHTTKPQLPYDDEQLAFEIRRALLDETAAPDAGEAFAEFKRRNSHTSRRLRLVVSLTAAIAAACIATLIIIRSTTAGAPSAATSTAKAQVPAGTIVYEAQPATDSRITMNTGNGEEIKVGSSEAREAGIDVNSEGEIIITDHTPASESHEIETLTLTIPQGKLAKLMLDDGTTVWLSAYSRLIFPQHFSPAMPREVILHGEAYFKVAHDEARPFTVKAGSISTHVLGTQFTIRNFDGEQPQVTLIEGKVEVSTGSDRNITLSPDQTAWLDGNGTLNREAADMDVVTSWMSGNFYYDGQTLKHIMTDIGRWYNMSVVFENCDLIGTQLHFNACRNWSIKQVLEQLQLICTAKFVIKDNVLIVK